MTTTDTKGKGHREPRQYKGLTVEPFCAYVEWCGWPAGIIGVDGGVIAAGAAANETTLAEALKKATEETT